MSTGSAFPTFRLMGWSLPASRSAEGDDGRSAPEVTLASDTSSAAPIGGSAGATNPADALIANAKKFLGQPYLWGGGHSGYMSHPGPVDCSGLVTQAAHMAGISGLGGTAATIQTECRPVSMSSLQPGDLLFHGHPASHVGIYIGNGLCIQSPHTGAHVYITNVQQYGYFDNAGRFFNTPGHPSTSSSTSPSAPAPKAAPKPASTPASTPGGSYRVQSGDTLYKIAQRMLGDGNRWQEIYNLNRNVLSSPNLVYPGQVLKLPGASKPAPKPAPKSAAAPAPKPAKTPTPIPTPAPTPTPIAQLTPAQVQAKVAALQAELAQLDQEITALIQQTPPSGLA